MPKPTPARKPCGVRPPGQTPTRWPWQPDLWRPVSAAQVHGELERLAAWLGTLQLPTGQVKVGRMSW